MTTLAVVSAIGLASGRPPFGIAGRKYYATDTQIEWYDTGAAWVNITPPAGLPAAILAATPSGPGTFSIPHGLSAAPSAISVLMTSSGAIWAQSPAFDGTNVYLEASDAGVTATVNVYGS
jgi:hypothetical protein